MCLDLAELSEYHCLVKTVEVIESIIYISAHILGDSGRDLDLMLPIDNVFHGLDELEVGKFFYLYSLYITELEDEFIFIKTREFVDRAEELLLLNKDIVKILDSHTGVI